MSFQIMKKAMIAAVGVAALAGASAAQAVTITPGPGPYTFTGPSNLSAFGIQANGCTLSLTGTVTDDGTNTTVSIGSGSVSGGGNCGLVGLDFSNGDWTGTVADSSLSTASDQVINVPFTNVYVTAAGIPCTSGAGTITASYDAVNPTTLPTSFTFAGSVGACGVNGTLTDQSASGSQVQITNP